MKVPQVRREKYYLREIKVNKRKNEIAIHMSL